MGVFQSFQPGQTVRCKDDSGVNHSDGTQGRGPVGGRCYTVHEYCDFLALVRLSGVLAGDGEQGYSVKLWEIRDTGFWCASRFEAVEKAGHPFAKPPAEQIEPKCIPNTKQFRAGDIVTCVQAVIPEVCGDACIMPGQRAVVDRVSGLGNIRLRDIASARGIWFRKECFEPFVQTQRFVVNDIVRCVSNFGQHGPTKLAFGEARKVSNAGPDHLYLVGSNEGYAKWRFDLVVKADDPFLQKVQAHAQSYDANSKPFPLAIGDTVECVQADEDGTLVKGYRYTVREVHPSGNIRLCEISGNAAWFHIRFQKVIPQVKRDISVVQVGDIVRCLKTIDFGSTHIKAGELHEVTEKRGSFPDLNIRVKGHPMRMDIWLLASRWELVEVPPDDPFFHKLDPKQIVKVEWKGALVTMKSHAAARLQGEHKVYKHKPMPEGALARWSDDRMAAVVALNELVRYGKTCRS